jgi:hypothetical protein
MPKKKLCHRIPAFVVGMLGRPSYLELPSGSKEELGEEVPVERQRQS